MNSKHNFDYTESLYLLSVPYSVLCLEAALLSVLMRNCSENMQQIYKRTTKEKCDFNKVALYLYGNHTSA